MNIDDLSPELLEKAKACKTADELIALAEAEGVELTDASSVKQTCPLARLKREGASVERAHAMAKLQKLEDVSGGWAGASPAPCA